MDTPDPRTSLMLVRDARAGDRAAAEELSARYLPRVRQIVALSFSNVRTRDSWARSS